ncbi:unnamed protein product [Pleuronectes platessa]|uniref:Uncharacterized protein n=1 Tax=Pleuronectes platessa TaxID=8262 RepID=A0A9N7UUM7_PLEPL|nr:unnamed protein product [Pleuronectes platessa]
MRGPERLGQEVGGRAQRRGLAVHSSRVLRVGTVWLTLVQVSHRCFTPRADLTQTLAALLFFNTRPNTPPPPLFLGDARFVVRPRPRCVILVRVDSPPGQARGSGSSINNPELSLRREHALGSFTFQCL